MKKYIKNVLVISYNLYPALSKIYQGILEHLLKYIRSSHTTIYLRTLVFKKEIQFSFIFQNFYRKVLPFYVKVANVHKFFMYSLLIIRSNFQLYFHERFQITKYLVIFRYVYFFICRKLFNVD